MGKGPVTNCDTNIISFTQAKSYGPEHIEIGWDLGPFTRVLAIQRNYKGLKIAAHRLSGANYEQ